VEDGTVARDRQVEMQRAQWHQAEPKGWIPKEQCWEWIQKSDGRDNRHFPLRQIQLNAEPVKNCCLLQVPRTIHRDSLARSVEYREPRSVRAKAAVVLVDESQRCPYRTVQKPVRSIPPQPMEKTGAA